MIEPTYGQVVRGVSFTPGTPMTNGNTTSPQPSLAQVTPGPAPSRAVWLLSSAGQPSPMLVAPPAVTVEERP